MSLGTSRRHINAKKRPYGYAACICITLWLGLLFHSTTLKAQCGGALGDPIFKETFGDAGTTNKPVLGPALPAGINSYPYYSPSSSQPYGPNKGQYTISNTTRGYNDPYFVDRPDHTSSNGSGFMMVVDASATPGRFYQRTINGLCAGTFFEFSVWVTNINSNTAQPKPSVRFSITNATNGAELASVTSGQVAYTPNNAAAWTRLSGTFQMPAGVSSVVLSIYNNTPNDNGNDLAIDDIAFAACGPVFSFSQGAAVCQGGNTFITGSLPAGSYSAYYFQVQNRPVGDATWQNLGSAVNNGTSNTYTYNITNAQPGYQYRILAAGGLTEINSSSCRVSSDSLTINVSPTPTVANAGPPQTLCAAASATLAANTPVNGTGAWTKISGPGTQTFSNTASPAATVSGLTTGNYVFRWTISSGPCVASTSDVNIAVQGPLSNNTVTAPATVTFCGNGDPAVITGSTPTGGDNTYAYQWQSSTDNTNWNDINGANVIDYDPPAISITTYYRRSLTSGSCGTASYSNVVTITVQPPLSANTITAPATTTFCGNGDATLITGSTPAGGNGVYVFQWQRSTDSTNWTDIGGAAGISYDPPSAGVGTVYYRRLVTSGSCTTASVSNGVRITVNPALTSGTVGNTQTLCGPGDPIALTQLTAPTGGNGIYSYQWQSSTTSATDGFTNITSAAAAAYDPPVITQSTYYRRVVNAEGCAAAASASITIVVNPVLTAGVITGGQSFCASGDPAVFTQSTASAGGNGVYSYQWQRSTTSDTDGFTDIANATGVSYDAATVSVTTWYRRITRSSGCTDAISNVLSVTITPAITGNTITADQVICSGDTPAALAGSTPAGGTGVYTYLWESSTNGVDFAAAAGVNTNAGYTPAALTATTIFRRQVASGACANNVSNTATITARAPATVANAGPDQGPLTTTATNLAGNNPTQGAGVWTQISGPNTATIITPNQYNTGISNLAPTTYLFRWTISNAPCPSSSDEVTIRLNVPPTAGNDNYRFNEDEPQTLIITQNDGDIDGSIDLASIAIATQPTHGTLTVNSDGTVLYTSAANYFGNDNFTYSIKDNLGIISNVALVTLTINPVNDPPVAADDIINLNRATTITIAAPGVLSNDIDVDNTQISAVAITQPAHGTVTLSSNGALTYTPEASYVGQDNFRYRVCDPSSACDTATVYFNIDSANRSPVAVNDAYTTPEDVILTINEPGLLANDSDPDQDALFARIATPARNGIVTISTNGRLIYRPAANYNGPDSFTYEACDGSGACAAATVNITVTPVNDPPQAVTDSYNTPEGVTLTVTTAAGVLTNDRDVDNGTLTATLISNVSNGTLTLNANGSFTYTPAPYFNGVDVFRYRVCDNGNPVLCDSTTVNISVTAVNDTATAVNDSYTTPEDITLNILAPGVLGNDTDPDNDPLTATILTQPQHGSITQRADGSFAYTPVSNYNGTDSYTYRACDPSGACATATVNITITPVNDPPVAGNDVYDVQEDATLVQPARTLLANDVDPEGDALTVSLVGTPAHGSVTVNPDGGFTYTPAPDYNGRDTFTYRICDNGSPSLCDTAIVTLNVLPTNDPPVAQNDSYTTQEDVTLNIAGPGVLANDTDIDGDALTATLIRLPFNGGLTLNPDGSFAYRPNPDYSGTDTFVYRVCDGKGACDTATVTIITTPVNDPPHANDREFNTDEDVPLNIGAPGPGINDSDPDGDPLTFALVAQPLHGTVTLNADGAFVYTPDLNFNGVDTFVYRACDNGTPSLCDTARAIITVRPLNDFPVAQDDSYTTPEDTPLTIAAPGVLANDTDVDGDPLTVNILRVGLRGVITYGALELHADGSFIYRPVPDFNGVDTFYYTVCDPSGACDTAIIRINVTPVNDMPRPRNDSYVTDEDKPLAISTSGVLFNDLDPEDDPLTASVQTPPAHGTLTLNTDGSFTYTPAPDFNGVDSFVYRACDNATPSLCDTAIARITVRPLNDPPIANADNYTLDEDVPFILNAPGIMINDTDVEGDTLTTSVVTQPAFGTIAVNLDGSIVYTPRSNYYGRDSLIYQVCDHGQPSPLCDTAYIYFTIRPVNDPPRANVDNFITPEDSTLTVPASGVLFNDIDYDGDAFSVDPAGTVPPAHGTLALNTDGSFTYTPAPGYNGVDSFIYRACDVLGACADTVVYITVTPVNDPPLGVDDAYTINEDTHLDVNAAQGVLANDSDPDEGDPHSTALLTNVTQGALTLNEDGSFTYLPVTNFNGVDSFTYIVCDNFSCDTATVRITVNPVDDPPVALDDYYSIPVNTPFILPAPGILENDYDAEGGPLTTVGITSPANGSAAVAPDGSLIYTPAIPGAFTDSITYQVCDANNLCDTARIYFIVGGVNRPPVVNNEHYTVVEDQPLIITTTGILENDSDPDGGRLFMSNVVSLPVHGILAVRPNGSFSYMPRQGYNGVDTFVVNVCDQQGACANDTIFLEVPGINHPPRALGDRVATGRNIPVTRNVLDNDTDVDIEQSLTAALVTAPVHGTVVLNANGSFTYTPATDFMGTDQFLYQACDNGLPSRCDTALVEIYVVQPNSGPVVLHDEYVTDKNTTLDVADTTGVLANDVRLNINGTLRASLVTPTLHGALELRSDGSFIYVPVREYAGPDSFIYRACNVLTGLCNDTVARIEVRFTNSAPVALNDTVTTNEEVTVNGNVLLNDTDPDAGDGLTVSPVTAPQHGAISLSSDGTFTYTPSPGFNGADYFTYQVCDNNSPSLCGQAVVFIVVNPVNDPPIARDDHYMVLEGMSITVPAATGVLHNDTDEDDEALVPTLLTRTAGGALVFHKDGAFSYIPEPYFNGLDSFIYRVCDISGACDTAVAYISITSVNNRPVAVDDIFTLDEDKVITFPASIILANDLDPDNDTLSGVPIGSLQHGSYITNPDGTYTYTPAPDFTGIDSIRYQVCDPYGLCDTGLIKVSITPVNDTPVAEIDRYSISRDSILVVPSIMGVLVNDHDVDDASLRAALITGPMHGYISMLANGNFQYQPDQGFRGLDSVQYSACDSAGACSNAWVYITVTGQNRAPIAVPDNYTGAEDQPITIPARGVLANDNDPDNDELFMQPGVPPLHGSITLNSNGSFEYIPEPNYYGQDVFTYTVCDGDTLPACATATVTLTITPVPDAPLAMNDSISVREDSTITVSTPGVLQNDVNVDNDELFATMVTGPRHGVMQLFGNGGYTYTPAPYYRGLDSITYRICNTSGSCDTAVLIITVTPYNHPPVAVDDVFAITEDTVMMVVQRIGLLNDHDPDGDILTGNAITNLSHGTLVDNQNGTFTYTPEHNYNGEDSLLYQACDPYGLCDTAWFKIIILPANDPPVALGDHYTVAEDSTLNISVADVLSNDSDVDGDQLNTTVLTEPLHGILIINDDKSFAYIPDRNFHGLDSFLYIAYDPSNAGDTATVYITVLPVNDPPQALANVYNLEGNTSVSDNVLTNDSDPDGDPVTASIFSPVTHGTLLLQPDGSFTYTPDIGYSGVDHAIYQVTDPNGLTDTAMVTFIIAGVETPPRPSIGVAKALAAQQVQSNGDIRLTYKITVKNMGDVPLTGITLTDNLPVAFPPPLVYQVISLSALGPLVVNTAFNGSSVANMLLPVSVLPVGATDTVTLVVNITPNNSYGTFNNQVTVEGNGNDTTVTDESVPGPDPDPDGDGDPSEEGSTPSTLTPRDIFFPNTFTPNGDGRNDKFVIPGLERYPGSALYIYNRWGSQVYQNKNYANDWNGSDLREGTYFYILELRTPEGIQKYKGWVLLVR